MSSAAENLLMVDESSRSFPFCWLRWRYPTTDNFITVVSNSASEPLQARVRETLTAHAALPVETFTGPWWIPGVDFSDHSSFWKEGYQAVMLTDTAFYRTLHDHRGTDRPETLDYPAMAELTGGLYHVLLELDRASRARPS
jgi:hypothetical protein